MIFHELSAAIAYCFIPIWFINLDELMSLLQRKQNCILIGTFFFKFIKTLWICLPNIKWWYIHTSKFWLKKILTYYVANISLTAACKS